MSKTNIILFLMPFIMTCVDGIAQSEYYYYNEHKIPLSINKNKLCVSVLKELKSTSQFISSSITIDDTISDDLFDIYVVSQSEYEKLYSLNNWKQINNSVQTSPCYTTIDDIEVFLTPYLNIRLNKEQDFELLYSIANNYGLEIVRQDPLMPLWYILCVTPQSHLNALECANAIMESGYFSASIPDLSSDDSLCSNDSLFYQQWGLQNNDYTGMDISASPAWYFSTGKYVKLAILDQGVDLVHIDLASNISSFSYDTETNTSPSIVYGDHGTHCAGIAAAVKDNGIQIAGVAPEATIVSISNKLSGTNSQLKRADGFIWAYQNGVDIISNSWHSSVYHSSIDEAINDAFKYGRHGKGCVIIFASGNNGRNKVNYPARCNDTIIAVGSINKTGVRSTYSNYGTELDLVAPGDSILSTLPNNITGFKTGTSMACPHVAGVAALILGLNSELTVTQVNSIINSTAKKISGVNFNITKPDGLWNVEYGYGLVDAFNAVINTPGTAFIQNYTIVGSRIITSDTIIVGEDVTNTKEYGDVIMGPGNIMLKGNNIVIKNSTIVPLGTTLRIEN